MPSIEVDFESWKEITQRRTSEAQTEGDVIRELLNLNKKTSAGFEDFWETEGVRFKVGTLLEHRFRDGRIVEARVTPRGIEHNGTIYSGLSPAGAAITTHPVNGWLFWFYRDDAGKLLSADTLRKQ